MGNNNRKTQVGKIQIRKIQLGIKQIGTVHVIKIPTNWTITNQNTHRKNTTWKIHIGNIQIEKKTKTEEYKSGNTNREVQVVNNKHIGKYISGNTNPTNKKKVRLIQIGKV